LVPPKSRAVISPCASSRSVMVIFSPLTITCRSPRCTRLHGTPQAASSRTALGAVFTNIRTTSWSAPQSLPGRRSEAIFGVALPLMARPRRLASAALAAAERALGRYHDSTITAAALDADCRAQTCQPATDHEHVGIDDVHRLPPACCRSHDGPAVALAGMIRVQPILQAPMAA
jgi:hypothetical protein